MKSSKVLILAIIFALLTSIFAMSDDGGKEPVVEKKEVRQEVVPAEAKSNKTVIDLIGMDTGKNKKKIEEFRQNYRIKYVKLFPKKRKSAYSHYYNYKINLNKIDEFEKSGLDLRETSIAAGASYKRNTLYSDIIVIGKVVELITKGEDFTPRYKLKIEEIIVGTEVIENFFGEIPEYLYYIAFLGVSMDKESILNKKGLYFLGVDPYTKVDSLFRKGSYSTVSLYNDSIVCYERDYHKFDRAFKYMNGEYKLSPAQEKKYKDMYLKRYKECNLGSRDDVIVGIKKILTINDSKNFYKREYKLEEEIR